MESEKRIHLRIELWSTNTYRGQRRVKREHKGEKEQTVKQAEKHMVFWKSSEKKFKTLIVLNAAEILGNNHRELTFGSGHIGGMVI